MNGAIFKRMEETGDRYWWYAGKRHLLRELLGTPPTSPSGLILDLGCGAGTLLPFLHQYGRPVGLEPSADAVAIARKSNAGMLIRASAEALPFRTERFALVAAFDCLEHVPDDALAVRSIRSLLTNDGRLLISVPAHSFLRSHRDTQLGHLRRYSRRSLTALLEQTGFSIDFLGYGYACLFIPLLLESLRDRLIALPGQARSDIRDLPEPWNGWMSRWLALEAWWAVRVGLPVGTSLFAMARLTRKTLQ